MGVLVLKRAQRDMPFEDVRMEMGTAAEYAWQSSIAGEEICATDLGVAFGYGLIAGAFGEILAPQTGRINARYGSLPFESSLYQSSMNSTLRMMIAKETLFFGLDDVFRSSLVNIFVTKESFLYGN